MPAAYTHTFIARKMLERIGMSLLRTPPGQPVAVEVVSVDGTPPRLSMVPYATASLLVRHQASFLFGATSPDFFVDVLTGITTSHQPKLRRRTLAEYLELFSRSLDEGRQEQAAFLLGWLAHLCADVFGHHWVGNEAGGAFETWFDTRPEGPEIIRKHIGIEMTWDEIIHAREGDRHLKAAILSEFGVKVDGSLLDQIETLAPLVFERPLVRSAMLAEDAPLCKAFYDYGGDAGELAQIALPMIRLQEAAAWHARQAVAIDALRRKLDKPGAAAINAIPLPKISESRFAEIVGTTCPLCTAHGVVTEIVERACPVCQGVGIVERAARGICLCGSGHGKRVPCPKCEGIGSVLGSEGPCRLCAGSGRIKCSSCGGSGLGTRSLPGRKLKARCKSCAGIGSIPCAHPAVAKVGELLRDTCPDCHGEREIPELDLWLVDVPLCPFCLALRTGANFVRERCPQCKGARSARETLDSACPVCKARAAAHKVLVEPEYRTLDLAKSVCERLAEYHRMRQRRIESLTAAYLKAHEHLGFLLASKEKGGKRDVAGCFKDFLDQLSGFWISTLTFSDLVPELAVYGDAVRKAIDDTIKGFKDLVPDFIKEWLERLRKEAVEAVIEQVKARIDLPLTDAEKAKVRTNAIGMYPIDQFPPLADAIQLFLLALDGAEPTRSGLSQAFSILGEACNIDDMGQPMLVRPYNDPAFSWNSHFRLVGRNAPGEEARIRIGI